MQTNPPSADCLILLKVLNRTLKALLNVSTGYIEVPAEHLEAVKGIYPLLETLVQGRRAISDSEAELSGALDSFECGMKDCLQAQMEEDYIEVEQDLKAGRKITAATPSTYGVTISPSAYAAFEASMSPTLRNMKQEPITPMLSRTGGGLPALVPSPFISSPRTPSGRSDSTSSVKGRTPFKPLFPVSPCAPLLEVPPSVSELASPLSPVVRIDDEDDEDNWLIPGGPSIYAETLGDLDPSLPAKLAAIKIPQALRNHVFIRHDDNSDDWYYVTAGRGLGVTNMHPEATGYTTGSSPGCCKKAADRKTALKIFAHAFDNGLCIFTGKTGTE